MGQKKKHLKGLFQEGEYEVRVPKFPVPKVEIRPKSELEKEFEKIRKVGNNIVRQLKRKGVTPFLPEYAPPPKPAKKK